MASWPLTAPRTPWPPGHPQLPGHPGHPRPPETHGSRDAHSPQPMAPQTPTVPEMPTAHDSRLAHSLRRLTVPSILTALGPPRTPTAPGTLTAPGMLTAPWTPSARSRLQQRHPRGVPASAVEDIWGMNPQMDNHGHVSISLSISAALPSKSALNVENKNVLMHDI